jgi:methionyl-tRNA formyltransferase
MVQTGANTNAITGANTSAITGVNRDANTGAIKIVFFGTPEFAVPSLERLLNQATVEVVAVVTQPDKRRGRGNQVMPSPIKTVALAHGLPVWQPKSIKKDPETLAALAALQADVFVVVAYGQILSQAILDMPRWGCVNGHGSILPKYRGAAPIQWCLYHGETETGITTMQMDAGMDTGAMLLTATVPVGLLDTAQDLAPRLATLTADLLVETLDRWDSLTAMPQDSATATYAPLIQKADFELDWGRSAIALHNQVRGFVPNCVTRFRGEALKVMATVPLDPALGAQLPEALQAELRAIAPDLAEAEKSGAPAGAIVALAKQLGPVVQTGNGLLLLRDVQLAGKKAQSGKDFVNGLRVAVGERFGE